MDAGSWYRKFSHKVVPSYVNTISKINIHLDYGDRITHKMGSVSPPYVKTPCTNKNTNADANRNICTCFPLNVAQITQCNTFINTVHLSPNPSLNWMAANNFSLISSLLAYAGNNSALKHVCAVGS